LRNLLVEALVPEAIIQALDEALSRRGFPRAMERYST
jgi:hypothetical protein